MMVATYSHQVERTALLPCGKSTQSTRVYLCIMWVLVSLVCVHVVCVNVSMMYCMCVLAEYKSLYVMHLLRMNSVFLCPSSALETSVRLGGEGLVPFYRMLDGGRDGTFFAELEDYFYYAQIKRLVF